MKRCAPAWLVVQHDEAGEEPPDVAVYYIIGQGMLQLTMKVSTVLASNSLFPAQATCGDFLTTGGLAIAGTK
eukprot:COSAG02_NODE_53333_length_302_cov_1.014778_1_plen_71_part_10